MIFYVILSYRSVIFFFLSLLDMNFMSKTSQSLPISETFYSLQGEGRNSGKAAYFIRLAGCDVKCSWCDSMASWSVSDSDFIPTETVVKQAVDSGTKTVVITGGEPLKYPLDELCRVLKNEGMEILLETSGTEPLSGSFDWICLSPKKHSLPRKEIYTQASELKVIIISPEDFIWAEKEREKVSPECLLYLQPEWSNREKALPLIIEYIKMHPEWRLSLQIHKFINIQ